MTGERGKSVAMPAGFDDERLAARVLTRYFRRDAVPGASSGEPVFSGAYWDDFDPSGTRAGSLDRFTADDLLACSLLSTPIGGNAAVALLITGRERFGKLLERIPADRHFVECGDDGTADPFDFAAVNELYRALVTLPGIGETRATKLLARKRPHLVPIVDSVVRREVFGDARRHWEPLHEVLIANGCAWWKRLEELHRLAGLPDHVPVLRVLDVLAWMDGTGRTEKLIGELKADQK